mgnify:CR=1 FL=1
MDRPPLPPFTLETATQKVRLAEDAWNSRDPARVALAYSLDSRWRNRDLRSFDTPEFRALKEEIQRSGGNVQPIKVRRLSEHETYEIVYGRRRTRACLELGLMVAAVVEDLSEQQAYMEMYRENVARENLTPWEQGVMYDDALTQGLFPSLRRLADALGISSGNVAVARKLAHLPSGLDHGKGDLTAGSGVVDHPNPTSNDEQHVPAVRIAAQDPLSRGVAAPAAAHCQRSALGRC